MMKAQWLIYLGLARALAVGCLGPPQGGGAAPAAPVAPPVWKVAVVFRMAAGLTSYLGVSRLAPSFPGAGLRSKQLLVWDRPRRPPMRPGYYLLLEGDGCTAEVAYDSAHAKYRDLRDLSGVWLPDTLGLAELVRAAVPCLPAPPPPKDPSVGAGDYPPPPSDLRVAVNTADVIAAGRIVCELGEYYAPPQSRDPISEHTTFLFVADTPLKGVTGLPCVLKIVHSGAGLPWSIDGAAGIGSAYEGDAAPEVGKRYIVFLTSLLLIAPRGLQVGYFPATDGHGVTGVGEQLDEYRLAAYQRSLIEISRGVTWAAQPRFGPSPPWQFDDGEQLIGVGLNTAVSRISTAAASEAAARQAPARKP